MLEFLRATAEDLEDYMKAKIDAFSDDLRMYGFGPTGYDDYDKELKNIEQYPTYKIVLDGRYLYFQRVSESRNRGKSNYIFRKRVSRCKVLEIAYATQKLSKSSFL